MEYGIKKSKADLAEAAGLNRQSISASHNKLLNRIYGSLTLIRECYLSIPNFIV